MRQAALDAAEEQSKLKQQLKEEEKENSDRLQHNLESVNEALSGRLQLLEEHLGHVLKCPMQVRGK